MKYLIYLLQGIIIWFGVMCAFGGGCLFWLPIAYLLKVSPEVNEIGFYLSSLILCPFGIWLSGFLGKKWL